MSDIIITPGEKLTDGMRKNRDLIRHARRQPLPPLNANPLSPRLAEVEPKIHRRRRRP